MKKLLAIIGVCVLAGAGIFAAGYFNAKKSDRIGQATINSAPEAEDEHEDEGGTDPKTLPQVDLTNQTEVTINIKDYAFVQPNIKIKKGTKVTWTNQDTMHHNAMREHDESEHAHSAPSKNEVRDDLFAGPLLGRGESYSFTFNKVEALTYHCAPHPYMKGTITIVE